ncbi:MAG: hypothetical protein Q4F83_08870 [Eubacteriales bacterium]|nr:hypothetical protein [Eubacteriales bacterium]
MKEIGGYLQMEKGAGKEYHTDMLKLNLGRTALIFLMKAAGAQTLWVPHFLCGCVMDTCEKSGIHLKYYSIDKNFLPIMPVPPADNEYLYLVNYYGQLTDAQIKDLAEVYPRIILDNTHAFFQKPLPGIPALYSIRKFFGLSDGAYIFPGNLPAADFADLPRDVSGGRMEHILGRYESSASKYYQTMLKNAHSLDNEPAKKMSLLTENLLRCIDYSAAKAAREANYSRLNDLLGSDNCLTLHMPEGSFTYPFYHKDGIALRKKLAQYQIFVPTYWSNVIADMPVDSLEYDYAANILPLPCDQRYCPEDMAYLTDILKQCLNDLEKK